MDLVVFYIFAGITVLASIGVVSARSPMHSVMLLIVSFAGLAGLYIQLDAPFTAVTQIIIYAGAIMVLFLFVVMLLNAHTEDEAIPKGLGPHGLRLAVLLSLLLAFELVSAIMKLSSEPFDLAAATSISSVTAIGNRLFSTSGYAFAFEVTSVLILVSMVGAVVIARRPRKESQER
jgi:NADH-quinone oxidoreductase subunit J